MTITNKALIYTLEYIIDHGNEITSNLTKLHVYKFLYRVYLDLKNVGIDIKLPYSWYLHGTMVESVEFLKQTGCHISNYFDEFNNSFNYYNIINTVELPQDLTLQIQHVVDPLLEKYLKPQGWDLNALLRDVYASAPYEFQRTYKFNLQMVSPKKISNQDFFDILNKLLVEFPDTANYQDIYPVYLRWDDTMRLAIDSSSITNDEKKDLIDQFWKVFAAKLRTCENENLTKDDVFAAQKFYNEKIQLYKTTLAKTREDYLLKYSEPLTPDEENILHDLNKVASDALFHGV